MLGHGLYASVKMLETDDSVYALLVTHDLLFSTSKSRITVLLPVCLILGHDILPVIMSIQPSSSWQG